MSKKFFRPLIFTAMVILILALGYQNLDYHWQWYRVWPFLYSFNDGVLTYGLLLHGLAVTLKLSGLGLVFALFFGCLSAAGRLSRFPVIRLLAWLYIETIRNTPLLIQIFFIYFVISPVLGLSAFASALIALSLFEGAYASEIIRSGIVNIPSGQIEAAQSIGLSTRVTYMKIIIPQMLRQTLPMLAGQSVSLIKDSALVSTISIYDLTMQGQRIVSQTFLTFEIWFTVALCYLIIAGGLSFLIRQFEKRINYIQ